MSCPRIILSQNKTRHFWLRLSDKLPKSSSGAIKMIARCLSKYADCSFVNGFLRCSVPSAKPLIFKREKPTMLYNAIGTS